MNAQKQLKTAKNSIFFVGRLVSVIFGEKVSIFLHNNVIIANKTQFASKKMHN